MSTAIIYTRVSTQEQTEGISLEAQTLRCREYCALHNLQIVAEYVDSGRSAYSNTPRAEFQRALLHACTDKVSAFVCWDGSRFARNALVALSSKFALKSAGVTVRYVTTSIDTSKPEGSLLDGFMDQIHEFSSVLNAQNTRRSMFAGFMKRQWTTGKPPYGFVKNALKQLEIIDAEADQIKMIFAKRLAGIGCDTIAHTLREIGLSRRGKRWTKKQVATQLSAKIVTGVGEWRCGETKLVTTLADFCPSIISAGDFLAAQVLLEQHTPKKIEHTSPISRHPLTGILRCGKCQSLMQIVTGTARNGKVHAYYRCGQWVRQNACIKTAYPAQKIESALLSHIAADLFNSQTVIQIRDQLSAVIAAHLSSSMDSIRGLESEQKRVESQIDRIVDAIANGTQSPSLTAKLGELEQTRAKLRKSSATMRRPKALPTLSNQSIEVVLARLRASLQDISAAATIRELLRHVIKHAAISADSVELTYDTTAILSVVHSTENWLPENLLLRTYRVAAKIAA